MSGHEIYLVGKHASPSVLFTVARMYFPRGVIRNATIWMEPLTTSLPGYLSSIRGRAERLDTQLLQTVMEVIKSDEGIVDRCECTRRESKICHYRAPSLNT